VFAASFAAADARLDALAPESIEQADEVYVLARASDASVKLRDDRLDVKRRLEVAPDGLEQWRPELKAAFPLSAEDVRFVLAALGVNGAASAGPAATLAALADAHTALRLVEVHKRREHHTRGGCMAERAELTACGQAVRTLAVEDEDPERVRAVVRELGLTDRRVTSVPGELEELLGRSSP
jgi:exopolyphosphatase/guanosine-5'-triphosphate,3'-diphosphate pyrophosphatase